jgi:enamine deaminase RidA (YjgF/YER057c/UK114 family)
MSGAIDRRLRELGVALPDVPIPSASYMPFTIDRTTVYLAGQTNEIDGVPRARGTVPDKCSVTEATAAAAIAGANLLAALRLACDGDLDRVERCLSVRGFVAAVPGFPDVPKVVNGASDLFVRVFGDAGKHVRTAIGVATLPRDAVVEVDAIFRLKQ